MMPIRGAGIREEDSRCQRERATLMSMEVRVNLDEREFQSARQLAGIEEPAALLSYVLREFVRFRTRQELLAMEGIDPEAKAPPRRRPPDFENR